MNASITPNPETVSELGAEMLTTEAATRTSTALRAPRESLHAFQQRISQRIAQAQTQESQAGVRLHVLVAGQHVLVPLLETSELVSLPAIVPLALAQDWVLGLSVVRAEVFSVFDLGRFLNANRTEQHFEPRYQAVKLDATGSASKQRLILLADSVSPQTAFVADAVLGLVNVAQADSAQLRRVPISNTPLALTMSERADNLLSAAPYITPASWETYKGEAVIDISLTTLMQDARFLNITRLQSQEYAVSI